MHLGIAVSQNPGYLKLRKIRAAQSISRTVSRPLNKYFAVYYAGIGMNIRRSFFRQNQENFNFLDILVIFILVKKIILTLWHSKFPPNLKNCRLILNFHNYRSPIHRTEYSWTATVWCWISKTRASTISQRSWKVRSNSTSLCQRKIIL